jgi:hypothetical protein
MSCSSAIKVGRARLSSTVVNLSQSMLRFTRRETVRPPEGSFHCSELCATSTTPTATAFRKGTCTHRAAGQGERRFRGDARPERECLGWDQELHGGCQAHG